MKGFEKFLSQVVAEGTREGRNEQLDEMDGKERDKNELPPRKRKGQNLEDGPSTEKTETGNKPPKKNQTKTPSQQKKAPKKDQLLATSDPSTENSASKLTSPSPPPPSPNRTSLSPALESDEPPPLPSILSSKPRLAKIRCVLQLYHCLLRLPPTQSLRYHRLIFSGIKIHLWFNQRRYQPLPPLQPRNY